MCYFDVLMDIEVSLSLIFLLLTQILRDPVEFNFFYVCCMFDSLMNSLAPCSLQVHNLLSYIGTSLAGCSRGERKHSCHYTNF